MTISFSLSARLRVPASVLSSPGIPQGARRAPLHLQFTHGHGMTGFFSFRIPHSYGGASARDSFRTHPVVVSQILTFTQIPDSSIFSTFLPGLKVNMIFDWVEGCARKWVLFLVIRKI
jgi:hypothetical protein